MSEQTREARSLREWRTERGMSQGVLAREARAAQSTVSDIEAGILLPNVALALRLARALGVTVEAIIWRDDAEHHRPKTQD